MQCHPQANLDRQLPKSTVIRLFGAILSSRRRPKSFGQGESKPWCNAPKQAIPSQLLSKENTNDNTMPFKQTNAPELLDREEVSEVLMPLKRATPQSFWAEMKQPKPSCPQAGDSPELWCKEKANDGIARRAGRSPERREITRAQRGKLPQQRPRSPRRLAETGKPKGGASGGMQGGPRRGRSPITGPALPPAAQAAKTKSKEKAPCPQGTEISSQRASPFPFPSLLAAQASPPAGRRNPPADQASPLADQASTPAP